MPGCNKRARKKNVSSGRRKISLDGRLKKSIAKDGRRAPAIADMVGYNFLRHQASNRWPTQDTMQKSWEMLKDRKTRRPGKKAIKPMDTGFTLLDAVIDKGKTLQTLLTAASLKLKRVKRHPGYVLIRTYNLKNRPITII